jgi:hypothetical protein
VIPALNQERGGRSSIATVAPVTVAAMASNPVRRLVADAAHGFHRGLDERLTPQDLFRNHPAERIVESAP